ncbi:MULTISPECIES: helix-turn-helix domain-containing protein [unclassified Streptomyces]|uniref:helix-turn-helix domain-containing protein n=1 Tax=unclassified Streptomyces TaxID=2593676 RepID=UPI001F04304C|nr:MULTISPECIES: helix-turn-helix domain-containing protein [unclassified Streptomyces]MCH0563953.1 helix-turn-helix domain-containing protein [Streptomyces sp. MUM 2J]MCH0570720.1 helix-turn-helix domain-containing protein [Streptomyces sp. MUM 136J]
MTQSPATPLPPPKERRRLREAASLTQDQLAARVGVTRKTVRSWESGRTTPRGGKREAYAELLASLGRPTGVTVPQTSAGKTTVPPDAERTGRSERTARAAEPGAGAAPLPPEPELTAGTETLVRAAGRDGGAEPLAPAAGRTGGTGIPAPEETEGSSLTPAQAFDALYGFCSPALVRQAYLLTGRRELARESVERAFQLAWQRWPEVARDRDPAGWVRAAAYEYALSPWHRFRPRYRHPEPPPAAPADRTLLAALLALPPSYRRTLLLHDGVGLGLPDTAAETEASSRAAAHRLLHAREAVAACLPELADPAEIHRRLTALASAERLRAAEPPAVRTDGERRARFWTRTAIAFTVTVISATALTLHTAPTRYVPPVPPGEAVRGVPPRSAPGPLSAEERSLRSKLRGEPASGPQRLVPETR